MESLEFAGGPWFYTRDNQKHGPFSWEQFRGLAGAGEFRPGDMVLQQGSPRWLPTTPKD